MISINLDNMSLEKIFIEFRFRKAFSLPENKYKILEKYSEHYPLYNTDQPEALILFNPEKKRKVDIFIDRMVIDWEQPSSIGDFGDEVNNIVGFISKMLKIEVLLRVGLRGYWLIKNLNSQDINNTILHRFYSDSAKRTDGFADEIFDPSIRISGRKGNIKFNLAVSHQQQQVFEGAPGNMIPVAEFHNLLADIDVYRDNNMNVRNLGSFLKEAEGFIYKNVKEYLLQ